MATAATCLAVVPLAYEATAHADGPGGGAARHDHGPAARDADHRATGRQAGGRYDEHRPGDAADRDAAGRDGDHRPASRERGRHQGHGPVPPRTRIIFNAQAPRGPVAPGGTYQWPYTVTNQGPAPARNVALAARPDRRLKVVATPPQCRWTAHNNLVCRIGLIPGGQTRKGAITAKVDKKAPAGQPLQNPVRLSWDGHPDGEARYSGFPPVTVSSSSASVPASAAGLPATATVVRGADGRIPYEVSVTNNGPVTAEGLVVRRPAAGRAAGSPCTRSAASSGGLIGGLVGTVTGITSDLTSALTSCGAERQADPSCATASCGSPCASGACARSCNVCTRPNTSRTPPETVSTPPESAGAPPEARMPEVPGTNVPAVVDHGPHHPIGGVPPGRAVPPGGRHAVPLPAPAGPHGLRCGPGDTSVGCHTRAARPMAPHQAAPGRRLPNTGFAYGLLGLCGAGLTGIGFVLYRMGRVRRGRRERVATR